MKTYFLDNCLSLHQPLQPTLFMYNEHGLYMYRIMHCESTLSALSKLKTCQPISVHSGNESFKQSFIHLTKMVVLKMIDWARLSFKRDTFFCFICQSRTIKKNLFGPRQVNLVLIVCASSEGSGEPAHPRNLARTSAARSYKQWVKRTLQTESQIPGPSEWLGKRS